MTKNPMRAKKKKMRATKMDLRHLAKGKRLKKGETLLVLDPKDQKGLPIAINIHISMF